MHAVANKLNVTAPNLLPYFNTDGRYLHASIAVGPQCHKVGDKNFYADMKETASPNVLTPASNSTDLVEMEVDTHDHTTDTDRIGGQVNDNNDYIYDEGKQNLDLILKVMEEQDQLKQDVLTLGNSFIEDVQDLSILLCATASRWHS